MLMFLAFVALLLPATIQAQVDPYRNVSQIISDMGYPVQNYWALTSDGFYLSLIRIPHGKYNDSASSTTTTTRTSASRPQAPLKSQLLSQFGKILNEKDLSFLDNNYKEGDPKPVVLLQHGLLDSASTWVVNLDYQSLGFILADAGFDVFLGNVRGNTYSDSNKYYPTTSKEFWDLVDFDNMIAIDLPTMINATLEITGQKSLIYVGHSQGTLMGFCGFSSQPWLADKVDLFIALAPVAYVAHVESYLLNFLADLDFAFWLMWLGEEQFLPSDWIAREIAGTVCVDIPWACADIIFLLAGFDTTNLNDTRLPIYIEHTPAGTSVRNMLHWSQMVASQRLQMFDYGKAGNLQHYNSTVPPAYHPELLFKPPVAFFTGGQDILADPEDAQHLFNVLPEDNKPVLVNEQTDYNHLDFVWGENAYQRIYPDVVKLAKKYSQPNARNANIHS